MNGTILMKLITISRSTWHWWHWEGHWVKGQGHQPAS